MTSEKVDVLLATKLPIHVSGGHEYGCFHPSGSSVGLLHIQDGAIDRLSPTRLKLPLKVGSHTDFFKNADIYFYTEKYPKGHFSAFSSDIRSNSRRILSVSTADNSGEPFQSKSGGWLTTTLNSIWNTIKTVATVAKTAVSVAVAVVEVLAT